MLKEIAEKYGTIYVHMSDSESEKDFLRQAEEEGFVFGDGARPTEKEPANLIAVHVDGSVNYVGSMGRVVYQAHGVKSVEYSELKQAHAD